MVRSKSSILDPLSNKHLALLLAGIVVVVSVGRTIADVLYPLFLR